MILFFPVSDLLYHSVGWRGNKILGQLENKSYARWFQVL